MSETARLIGRSDIDLPQQSATAGEWPAAKVHLQQTMRSRVCMRQTPTAPTPNKQR
jgi:hypothetical protein